MMKKISDEKFFDNLRKKMDSKIETESRRFLKELKEIFEDEETIEVTAKELVDLLKSLTKGFSKEVSNMCLILSKYIKENYKLKKPLQSKKVKK